MDCLMDPPGHPDFHHLFLYKCPGWTQDCSWWLHQVGNFESVSWSGDPSTEKKGPKKWSRQKDWQILPKHVLRCFDQKALGIWSTCFARAPSSTEPLNSIEGKHKVLEHLRRPRFGMKDTPLPITIPTTSTKTRPEFGKLLRNPAGWSS